MKRILTICILALAVSACNKDKFKTEPQVEIKSLTPDVVLNDGFFSFKALIRDHEGDLQDTVYLVQKRFNISTGNVLTVDTFPTSLKEMGFPNSSEIELQVEFSYGEDRPGYRYINLESQDRNFSIGLIVKDKAGHKSEYVESEKITLKKL